MRLLNSAPASPLRASRRGGGLEVVAWLGGNGFHTEEKEATGAPFPLCHLSDAQRAIAELQAKLDDPDYPPKYSRRLIAELRGECEHLKACQENAMLHMTGLVAERDTLRQQLAERDAEIMEQCRLNGIGAERELKLLTQRDKLAGLLRDFSADAKSGDYPIESVVEHHVNRIDAALAEVDK